MSVFVLNFLVMALFIFIAWICLTVIYWWIKYRFIPGLKKTIMGNPHTPPKFIESPRTPSIDLVHTNHPRKSSKPTMHKIDKHAGCCEECGRKSMIYTFQALSGNKAAIFCLCAACIIRVMEARKEISLSQMAEDIAYETKITDSAYVHNLLLRNNVQPAS